MAKRVPEVNDHQARMFNVAEDQTIIPDASFIEGPVDKVLGHSIEYETVYGQAGSYVDVAERAEYLIDAVNAINQRVFRLGFDTGSNVRKYDAPIWARYREFVPIVQKGARKNADKYLDDAKLDFWQSTGYQALRANRLAPRKTIDALARQDWEDFHDVYGGRKSIANREALKKILNKQIKISHKIISSAAA